MKLVSISHTSFIHMKPKFWCVVTLILLIRVIVSNAFLNYWIKYLTKICHNRKYSYPMFLTCFWKLVKGEGNAIIGKCPCDRACPKCFTLNRHTSVGCRMFYCGHCKHKFCFMCLQSDNSAADLNKGKFPGSNCVHDTKPCRNQIAVRQTNEKPYGL